MDLKSKFLRTLFEWVSITTSPELLSFEEFLDSCNLSLLLVFMYNIAYCRGKLGN